MDTLGRTLLLRFVRTASASLVAFALVVLAATSLWVLQSAPGVRAFSALQLGLDALLVGCEAWSSVLAAAAIGIVAYRASADRHLLVVAMTGRAAWRPFVACWCLVGCACILQSWLLAEVVPEANFRLRWPVQQGASMAMDAIRSRGSGSLGPVEVRGHVGVDGACSDFVMAVREGRTAMAVCADTASIGSREADEVDEVDSVRLSAQHGRLVVRDPDQVLVNVAFDALDIELDSKFAGRPSRSALLPLSYYRSSELSQYAQQRLVSLRAGAYLKDAQSLRADAIDAMHALRTTASFQPLFAVVLMTLAVARPRVRSVWVVVAAMAAVVIGLVTQIALETAVGRLGVVCSAWVAAVPPLVGGVLSMPLWRGGIARA